MSSPSPRVSRTLRIAPVALAALLDAVWLSASASLALPRSPLVVGPLVSLALLAGAAAAWWGRRRDGGAPTTPFLAAAVLALTAAALAVPPPLWRTSPLAAAVLAPALAVACLWFGGTAGRHEILPDEVLARASRAFLLTFAVLLLGVASGRSVSWAGAALALALTLSVTLAAATRLAVSRDEGWVGDRSGRLWVAAMVVGSSLALVVAGALAGAVPSGVVMAVVRPILRLLGYVAYGLAMAVGFIGFAVGALLKTASGHHPSPPVLTPTPTPSPSPSHTLVPQAPIGDAVLHVLVYLVPVAAAVLLVVVAVRLRRRPDRGGRAAPVDVVEERESTFSSRAALRDGLTAVRGAFGRLARLRVAQPRQAPEALRHEYRRLERDLVQLGRERRATLTVRGFLTSLGEALEDTVAADELARLYERARYSREGVGWDEVERFKAVRAGFVTVARAVLPGLASAPAPAAPAPRTPAATPPAERR